MLPTNENRLSGRSLLLGTCFVIAICCIVSYAELVITYIQIGFLQLPPAVIGLFFFLIIGNRLLEKLSDRLGLSPRELMCTYCMMLIASMISSRGVMEKLIPALIAVNYFTNETNSWDTLFFPHIKPWLIPFSPEQKGQAAIATSFYGGIRQYQRLRPFFLGMVFGEFSMAVVWTLISWAANVPAPFFPWP